MGVESIALWQADDEVAEVDQRLGQKIGVGEVRIIFVSDEKYRERAGSHATQKDAVTVHDARLSMMRPSRQTLRGGVWGPSPRRHSAVFGS